jgi:sulfate adenylyltransferase
MRLADGLLWSMSVNLDVSHEFADSIDIGETIALRDREGVLIATMAISDKWTPDRKEEAELVLGTLDDLHPEVDRLLNHCHPVYLGGTLRGVEAPVHFDFTHHRHSPQELRDLFAKRS